MAFPTPNARFWFYWNEPTKITLKPGQTLELFRGGQTEEGWYRENCVMEHEGEGIRLHTSRDERDCDGRVGRFEEDYCLLEHLRSEWNSQRALTGVRLVVVEGLPGQPGRPDIGPA